MVDYEGMDWIGIVNERVEGVLRDIGLYLREATGTRDEIDSMYADARCDANRGIDAVNAMVNAEPSDTGSNLCTFMTAISLDLIELLVRAREGEVRGNSMVDLFTRYIVESARARGMRIPGEEYVRKAMSAFCIAVNNDGRNIHD